MRRRELIWCFAGVIAAPRVSAQERSHVIGYLSGGAAGFSAPYVAAFGRGLKDAGYAEGQNLSIEYRWAEGRYERLPDLAADLVARKVDIIVTSGGDVSAHAARNATSAVPVVFAAGGDPVADRLVASLNHPGRNLTGINFFAVELSPKRLELICEMVPHARRVGLLVNPHNSNSGRVVEEVMGAAEMKGVKIELLNASDDHGMDAAFGSR